jgi:hypothetical protein
MCARLLLRTGHPQPGLRNRFWCVVFDLHTAICHCSNADELSELIGSMRSNTELRYLFDHMTNQEFMALQFPRQHWIACCNWSAGPTR